MILFQIFDPATPYVNTALIVTVYLLLKRDIDRIKTEIAYLRGKEGKKERW